MALVRFLVDLPAGVSGIDDCLYGRVHVEVLQQQRLVLWRADAFLGLVLRATRSGEDSFHQSRLLSAGRRSHFSRISRYVVLRMKV